jgi:Flp pilus assembly protein TadD
MRFADLRAAAMAAVACCCLAGCGHPRSDDPDRAVTAESRLRVAAASEESGNREMAGSMYAEAAAAAPASSEIQLRAAEGLARAGKLEAAADILVRRLRDSPRDVDLLGALGGVQILAGKPEQAVATLSSVLAARPDDVRSLVNKAVALDMLRRPNEAQPLYRRALVLAPGDATISNDLALSLMLSGHLDEARQTLAPFRGASGMPDRMAVNLAILDAAGGRADLSAPVLLGRVGAADSAALMDAIRQAPVAARP